MGIKFFLLMTLLSVSNLSFSQDYQMLYSSDEQAVKIDGVIAGEATFLRGAIVEIDTGHYASFIETSSSRKVELFGGVYELGTIFDEFAQNDISIKSIFDGLISFFSSNTIDEVVEIAGVAYRSEEEVFPVLLDTTFFETESRMDTIYLGFGTDADTLSFHVDESVVKFARPTNLRLLRKKFTFINRVFAENQQMRCMVLEYFLVKHELHLDLRYLYATERICNF